MFSLQNTGHAIILQKTVSFKFCLNKVHLPIIYEKTKGQVPLGPLIRKQNINIQFKEVIHMTVMSQ